MAKVLPAQPSLENFRKQAKSLLRSHNSGNPSTCATLRLLRRFSDSSDRQILDSKIRLAEAQYALAMEYGFPSWNALKDAITRTQDDRHNSSITCSNSAPEKPHRSIVSGNAYYIESIIKCTEVYFRSFGLATNMYHHDGDIEWVAPRPGYGGPPVVFKVSLPSTNAAEQVIEELIPDLNDGKVPAMWVLSPLTDPKFFDILVSKGFTDGSNSDEWGMAMDVSTVADAPAPNPLVEVKKVASIEDFETWMDIANTALHRWKLLTIEHYGIWLEREEFAFYLGYIDGIPVSTVATIQDGERAGLEFVSTLREYEGQGAAYAVCLRAVQDLQANNVEVATLASFANAVRLYEKLGFRKYYEQVICIFQRVAQKED